MEEEGHKVNDYTNEDTDYTDDEDYNDEDYTPELETASKRQKRHTPEQIQELSVIIELKSNKKAFNVFMIYFGAQKLFSTLYYISILCCVVQCIPTV